MTTREAKRGIVFAEAGRPAMGIATAKHASDTEQYAAEELRRHLYAMCGTGPQQRGERQFARSIRINDWDAAAAAGVKVESLKLAPEAFHIASRGGEMHILGGGPRGALYGVYELLELLGCRWYAPEVTYIPRRPTLALPAIHKSGAPAFESRDVWIFEAFDPAWWVRNRLNGNSTVVPDYMGGHNRYHLFVHTFDIYVPPHEFFDGRPEYFSLCNGRRQRDRSQLCLANPDVLRLVTQRVLERMRQNPQASIFSVSQNDWDGYCQCPACQAVAAEEGSQAGPILRFVNAVATETAKAFPDKLIDTLAYAYSLDAPRRTRPHRNVRVRLCSINCCQSHVLGSCGHTESARFATALRKWSRLTDQIYIWHYITNFRHYAQPVPNLQEIHDVVRLYRRFGVYGLFMQGKGGEGGGAESSALRAYLLGRLMWDPSRPLWPIVDEFIRAYYGPAAAPHVRQYLDLFQSRVQKDRTLHVSLYESPTTRLFEGSILGRADHALAKAQASAEGDERRRLVLLRHGIGYVRRERQVGRFRCVGNRYRGDAPVAALRDHHRMVRDFVAAGMMSLDEGSELNAAELRARSRFGAHTVQWLTGGGQKIAVVPALGGRLVEWHAFGHQWLTPPGPEFVWRPYPAAEGYDECASLFSRIGSSEPYRCTGRGNKLTLTARLDGGLSIRRTYAFRAGRLTIDSRLRNVSQAPLDAALCPELHLRLPIWEGAAVSYPTKEGERTVAVADLAEGHGTTTLEGLQLPPGQWLVRSGRWRVEHTFTGQAIEQAILGRVRRWGMLVLDLRTASITLQPGQEIGLRQTVAIGE